MKKCIFMCIFLVALPCSALAENGIQDWKNRRREALDKEYRKNVMMMQKRGTHKDYINLITRQYHEALEQLERHYQERLAVFSKR